MLNNTTFPLIEPGFILAVKITAGTTCILSFLGSCLIIFTYAAVRDLRTAARQLLVNLSIADIIMTVSHFVGLFANFDRFIDPNNLYYTANISTMDPVCISQGAFTLYGSVSSFLWSMAIAFYLVLLSIFAACKKEDCMKKILIPILYIVCWGVPVILIIPNAVKHYFGFALAVDIGWCYISQVFIGNVTVKQFLIAETLGYEMWVYMAFIILPVLYIFIFVYMCFKVRRTEYNMLSFRSTQANDIKLLFVPAAFLLLRIWSTILDIIVFYTPQNEREYQLSLMTNGIAALTLLAGIGVNAQGFVNSILFCLLTKPVRQSLLSKDTYTNLFHCRQRYPNGSALDETSRFVNDRQFYKDITVSYESRDRNPSQISVSINGQPATEAQCSDRQNQ